MALILQPQGISRVERFGGQGVNLDSDSAQDLRRVLRLIEKRLSGF